MADASVREGVRLVVKLGGYPDLCDARMTGLCDTVKNCPMLFQPIRICRNSLVGDCKVTKLGPGLSVGTQCQCWPGLTKTLRERQDANGKDSNLETGN